MTDFTKIKTKYIKDKLKALKPSARNREYIEDLFKIERFVYGATFGWTTGYLMKALEDKYPKEWLAIHEEIEPGYAKKLQEQEQKEREKEKKDAEKWRRIGKKDAEQSLKTWAAVQKGKDKLKNKN